MELPSIWERLDEQTERLRAPGGWIVRSTIKLNWNSVSVHQVFVPDVHPREDWTLPIENVERSGDLDPITIQGRI